MQNDPIIFRQRPLQNSGRLLPYLRAGSQGLMPAQAQGRGERGTGEMRNISFMLTTEAMRNGTKTVTRRFGWWFLKAGDIVMAVEKGMGLKKGEKIKKLYPIEIITVRKTPINTIDKIDCIKEGFPDLIPNEFISMLCRYSGKKPTDIVNRIEFKRVTK